jgi:hypothetical protein
LFAATEVLALKMMSDLKSAAMLWPKIVTALFGIGLNVAGASIAGSAGVAYAAVCFSTLYFLWMLYLSKPRLTAASVQSAPR